MNIYVNDPPFFPIARYQKQESIHKTESPDQKVGLTTEQGFSPEAAKPATASKTHTVSSPALPEKDISRGSFLSVII